MIRHETSVRQLTAHGARAAARAVALFLKRLAPGKGCIIGYDHPSLTDTAKAAWSALTGEGVEAVLTDRPTPPPVTAHAVRARGAGGALMLTAPGGVQFIPSHAGPAPAEVVRGLEEAASGAPPGELAGVEVPVNAPAFDPAPLFDPARAYWAHMETMVDLPAIQRLALVCDAMHGAGAHCLARLQPATLLRAEPALPTGADLTEEGLALLTAAVHESGAALGLAVSGDAARFGCVDPRWGYVTANEALSLILWYLTAVKGRRGLVVRTVATTHLLDRIALRHGCGVMEAPVGSGYLAQAMPKHDVLLAGDESGGVSVAGHIPQPDGLLGCLLLAQIRAETGMSLRDLLVRIFDTYGPIIGKRVDVVLRPGDRQRLEERLARDEFPDKFGGRWIISVDRKDGFKFLLGNHTWALVRLSDSTAQIFVEAQNPTDLDRILRDLLEDVERR